MTYAQSSCESTQTGNNPSKRILLIDDEETILKTVGGMLEQRGYVVDRAHDLAGARSALDGEAYDLVITDLCLSDAKVEEGLLVIDHARDRCPATPVVVLTGYGSSAVEDDALRRGARGFFSKRERLTVLLGSVESFVGAGTPQEAGGRDA